MTNYFHFAIRNGTPRRVREQCLTHIFDRFGIKGDVELVSVEPRFRLYRIGYHHTPIPLPLRH